MYYKLKFCDKCGKIFTDSTDCKIVAYKGNIEDGTMYYCKECYSDICRILNLGFLDADKELNNFIKAYNKREK